MRRPARYVVADYLQQRAGQERRNFKVPAGTWQALCDHVPDPSDQVWAGAAAQSRLLYRCAESLYRHALDAGDGYAARLLVELPDREGRVEEARRLRRFGLPADD